MPSATLLYTAELLHPSDPGNCIMELDVSVEIDWNDGYEALFQTHDIFYTEIKGWGQYRWRKHLPLPAPVEDWVRSCIERDRGPIGSAIAARPEDDVVEAPRSDGGRLTLPEPF